MVSYKNVSRYERDPPTEGEERRIETSAPLYAAPEIEGIASTGLCELDPVPLLREIRHRTHRKAILLVSCHLSA